MGRGILKRLSDSLGRAVEKLPDNRKGSNAPSYAIGDAVKSAPAVFYFQCPSLLNFQQDMKRKGKRNNLEPPFGMKNTPGQDQIKHLADDIEPAELEAAFEDARAMAEEEGITEQCRVLDGRVLIAPDGVWHHSSKKMHCEHCLSMTKKEKTTHYHSIMAAAVVKPGSGVVLPLRHEFIRNEDGSEKQDCERTAAKRCLKEQGDKLKGLKPTFLGDDLYACHAICKAILDKKMSFIFTCKDDSHPWMQEQFEHSEPETRTRREWNGRNHLECRYTWVNGNRNSWITDKKTDQDNVKQLVECARARWKMEKGHNNVLKRRGYNLKHNFGHGKNHAVEIFCLLNLMGFSFHGIQDFADEDYRKARAAFS